MGTLTEAEKVAIRRHCGYPVTGSTPPGPFTGYRFFQAYGLLEYRLQHLTAEEEAVVRNTYLTNLALLESDIVGARVNLDTLKAAVWEHNPREQADREALFDEWRRRFCSFLGVPPGPSLKEGGFRMVM